MMPAHDIVHCIAIGDDVAVESPILAQMLFKEHGVRTGGRAVDGVVGAHDRIRMAVHDSGAECRQVRVLKIVIGNIDVEAVARRLRPTVHREMLRRGHQLKVVGVVTLQPFNEFDAHAGSEKWIFAKGLHAAAPARIAKDIDVRRPEGKPRETAAIIVTNGLVVLGAALNRDDPRDPAHERGVPGGREADGLREVRRNAVARHAVQRFVPPVVGRHAQSRNGRCDIECLADLFLERHTADEVFGTDFRRKSGVEIQAGRRSAGHRRGRCVLFRWLPFRSCLLRRR